MAMGRKKRRQASLFVATEMLVRSQGHPFYRKLNELLAEAGFDRWIEGCPQYELAEIPPDRVGGIISGRNRLVDDQSWHLSMGWGQVDQGRQGPRRCRAIDSRKPAHVEPEPVAFGRFLDRKFGQLGMPSFGEPSPRLANQKKVAIAKFIHLFVEPVGLGDPLHYVLACAEFFEPSLELIPAISRPDPQLLKLTVDLNKFLPRRRSAGVVGAFFNRTSSRSSSARTCSSVRLASGGSFSPGCWAAACWATTGDGSSTSRASRTTANMRGMASTRSDLFRDAFTGTEHASKYSSTALFGFQAPEGRRQVVARSVSSG